MLDGWIRARTPTDLSFYLQPGKHTLELRKTGHGSWRKELTMVAGQHLEVAAPVGALARILVKKPARAAPAVKEGTQIYKRWWFWTAVGAGVLVVAGGVTAGVLANQGAPDPELGGIKFD